MAIDNGGILTSKMIPGTSLVLVLVLLLLVRTTSAARSYHRNADIEESTTRDMASLSTQQRPKDLKTNGIEVHRSPWRGGGGFNASAHEVPSGPNPISNR